MASSMRSTQPSPLSLGVLPLPLLRGRIPPHAGNHHGGKAYTSRMASHTESRLFPLLTLFGVGACFAPQGMVLRRSNQQHKASIACSRRSRRGRAQVWQAVAIDEPEPLEFEVTPWAGLVEPRPIYAVSDSTGGLAKRLVEAAWCQFGFAEEAQLTICPDVRTASEVDVVVKEVNAACGDSGAFIIFSMASSELCAHMTAACAEHNISCIDALQPLLITMEEALGQSRLGSKADATTTVAGAEALAQPPLFVYAVSDSTGSCALESARRGVSTFPTAGIKEVMVCPEVRSVEEIRLIAKAARKEDGLVIFTFASTGMSRFMRQQCEMEGARYVDLYQPILLALELYLDYPSIGVPGGYVGSDAITAMQQKWSRKPVT